MPLPDREEVLEKLEERQRIKFSIIKVRDIQNKEKDIVIRCGSFWNYRDRMMIKVNEENRKESCLWMMISIWETKLNSDVKESKNSYSLTSSYSDYKFHEQSDESSKKVTKKGISHTKYLVKVSKVRRYFVLYIIDIAGTDEVLLYQWARVMLWLSFSFLLKSLN